MCLFSEMVTAIYKNNLTLSDNLFKGHKLRRPIIIYRVLSGLVMFADNINLSFRNL